MKTTAKHFKLFQACCKKWQERFGLKEYYLYFEHNDDNPGLKAWADADRVEGMAVLGLGKDWDDSPLNRLEIDKVSLHEDGEVMCWRIRKLLEPYYSKKIIDEHIHDIIRRLENAFFP